MASRDHAFEHLSISDNLRVAINTVSETEWKRFFESYRKSKQDQIETTSDDDLTKIKAQLIQITELENLFKALKQPVTISSQLTATKQQPR